MSAAAPKLTFLPDIVEEHHDMLQFLWTRRRSALRSPAYTERTFGLLEERIGGHMQGLAAAGERVAGLAGDALSGEEDAAGFAAAIALLQLGTPEARDTVMRAFATAGGSRLADLRDAFAHGPSAPLTGELTSLFHAGPNPAGAAAGEALAFKGVAIPSAQQLERFVRAPEASARAGAWRLAAYRAISLPATWYEPAAYDDEPAVRSAALEAAAWNASPAFSAACHAMAAAPTPHAVAPLAIFAAVAPPEAYQIVAAVASNPAAGPNRFAVVGSFGHPYFIDLLIKEMENPDPATAAAAGAAFTKMTGRDVESTVRAKVPSDGKPPADDFEAEFQDEVFLPDPDLARKHWRELAPQLAHSARICRGMDAAQSLGREQFAALDMESRWEYCLRARLFSGWQGTPLVLERYPQRF